jgi:metallo-beta-lactamase family protein
MKIEFSGAARGVTGSKHLLHINGKKILLDCGLFQGRRKAAIEANLKFPFDAKEIDAVVLSHAHIDHSGALPLLVKNGFTGPIYSTHATRDLCSLMLRDSAYIQEKDAEWIKKKLKDPEAEPLYTMQDAEKTIPLFRSVAYDQRFRVVPGVYVTFHDAGHILGSAVEEWEIRDEDTGNKIRLGFTGDLGRKKLPILKDPVQLENLDILMTESTYGNRFHDEIEGVMDKFAETVNKTVERGGKIFIPAFAVERTQEILYVIRELQHKGKLPQIPIFVDSPLATNATEIFGLHPECFDKGLLDMIDRGEAPFLDQKDGLQFTHSVDESKALNDFPGSAIIISASGMCEAGRIRHHLANNIGDPRNTLLVVGFMAANTLGRRLVEKHSLVKIFGKEHEVKMETVIFNAFSGHADQKGLLRFASGVGSPKDVFVVHGEEDAMEVFRGKLAELPNLKGACIVSPLPGAVYEIGSDKKCKELAWKNPISESLFEDLK